MSNNGKYFMPLNFLLYINHTERHNRTMVRDVGVEIKRRRDNGR